MKFQIWMIHKQACLPREERRTRVFLHGQELTGMSGVEEHGLLGRGRELGLTFGCYEIEWIEARPVPPPILEDRLRDLAAKWRKGRADIDLWDHLATATDEARGTCADELEALLNEVAP